MPHYVLKIKGTKKTRYIIWSTIVDAPIIYDMTRTDLKKYWEEEYGRSGMRNFDRMMETVEETGSSIGENPKEIMKGNRAGKNERPLSYDRIVAHCVDRTAVEPSLV
jgi:hypothetical protein